MKKILLVEDNDLISKLYREKIQKEGYQIDVTSSVDESLSVLEKEDYGLILLDIMLPGGKNGFDLLKTIKASEKHKNIPVIVVTNLDGQEETAEEMGAEGCLVKSNITLDVLLEKIKNLII